jgi:hypothetical protein
LRGFLYRLHLRCRQPQFESFALCHADFHSGLITRHLAVTHASLCRTAIIWQQKGEGNKNRAAPRHFLYVPLSPFVAV